MYSYLSVGPGTLIYIRLLVCWSLKDISFKPGLLVYNPLKHIPLMFAPSYYFGRLSHPLYVSFSLCKVSKCKLLKICNIFSKSKTPKSTRTIVLVDLPDTNKEQTKTEKLNETIKLQIKDI